MYKALIIFICLIFSNCKGKIINPETPDEKEKRQQAIVDEYVHNCAKKYNYRFLMMEWQSCLDDGLKQDSTVAYLWQQKAMPYFKARKYEVGMEFIDKAVKYDAERWQPYRAFIKCIFAKNYKDAIIDFEDCIKKYGNNYEMDHKYSFYIGLSYLQLNEFEKAEAIFKEVINQEVSEWGEDGHHPLHLFYYGISLYEQQKWQEAIEQFDKALKIYSQFSDVSYYKAICLLRLNKKVESQKLFAKAKQDAGNGYTINEGNSVYELYPYQVRW